MESELAEWAATPQAARLKAVFEELDGLRYLLDPGTRDLRDGIGPGKLLTAAYELIPFDEDGRSADLAELAAWCNDDERQASVWLWTGEGGTGKSRLMIEWCQRLAAQGWHTGFLPQNRTDRELKPLFAGVVPRLVVIDYAETRLDQVVRPLLQEMALARGNGPRLRVVLLARRTAGWWEALRQDDAVEDLLLDSPPTRALTALVDHGEDREAAFREAAATFAAAIEREPTSPLPVPDLESRDFDRVLYLHMAT